MPSNAIGYLGLKRQSARGAAATAAAFKFPVFSGGILPDIEHSDELMSNASRSPGDPSVTGATVPVNFETRAFVGSTVALLHAAMGGINSSGAGDPYTHALSTSTLPHYTFFESITASDGARFGASDVKCNTLGLSWEGPAPVRLNFQGLGCGFDATQADFDATAIDETDGDGYFFGVGGTFQWDAVGTSAADFTCLGGAIEFNNQLEPVPHAAQLAPYDHDEGQLLALVSLRVRPSTDLSEYIQNLTGATDGSGLTGDVQFGKVNLVFQEAGAGTHTLTLTSSRVPWKFEPVGIDPASKGVIYNVSGICRYNATESDALDVSVTNANAGSVYDAAA